MADAREIAGKLCPYFEDHTPAPEGYLNWHAWAKTMSKTHKQRKCPGCDRFEIWEPKAVRAILQEQQHEQG